MHMLNPGAEQVITPKSLHAEAWAEACDLIDLQLSPLGLAAIDELRLQPGDVVLDIGCGAGQTLLQLAERVGEKGGVIGVDIAPSLLEIARLRAGGLSQVKVIEADAQDLDLATRSVDAVFSRFGVMNFRDPVAAFANFHRILKPTGDLAFSCWRSLDENDLDRLPLAAANLEATDDTPFSFANPDYLRRTLGAAGFVDIAVQSHDELVSSGNVDAMTSVLLKVGSLGKIVRENPGLKGSVEPKLRDALVGLGDPSNVRLRAAVWIVTARA